MNAALRVGDLIKHLRSLPTPEVEGEWHPESRKLYVVHTTSVPRQAEQIAEDVSEPEMAHALFAMWLKGYKFGRASRALA